jgi:hypothetical protein
VTFCKLILMHSSVESQETALLGSIDFLEPGDNPAKALGGPIGRSATARKYYDSLTETFESGDDLPYTLRRAFFASLLLAADAEEAESAVLEAIQLWNSAEEPCEALFRNAVRVVLRNRVQRSSQADTFEAAESGFPVQLRGILRLPLLVRQCYVLRLLVGFSQQSVARMLDLSADEVSQHTCVALQRLAGFGKAYA